MLFDHPLAPLVAGLVIGAVMGHVARSTHFCTMAAFERHWFGGDSRPLRAWVLAALTALALTQLMAAAGLVDLGQSFYLTEPLSLPGAILGGLMFGIGMALVGTCAFGAIVRLGGGNLRALVVLTGIGLAALAAQRGITGFARIALIERFGIDLPPETGQAAGKLLGLAFGADLTIPLAALILIAGLWWVFSSAVFRAARSRILSGLAIGACIAAGWWITGTINAEGLDPVQMEAGSFVMPVGDAILMAVTYTGLLPDYGVGLVFGVFVGAALAAWTADDMRWEACDDARELSRHLLGAFLMGTGGVFALGCTIGQGVSAVSLLAVSAPVVMLSVAAGARIGLHILLEGRLFGFSFGQET